MKTFYPSLLIALTFASSAPASYMASGLPTSGSGIGNAAFTTGIIYGSAFSVTTGFYATSAALNAGNPNAFSTTHKVTIWQLVGSTYTPLNSVTFSSAVQGTVVSPAIQTGRNFRSLDFNNKVLLDPGDYFIGFSNVTSGDNFLRISPALVPASVPNPTGSTTMAAPIGTTFKDIKENIEGFSFTGTGRVPINTLSVGGGFTRITSGVGQNIASGNFANMNVFAHLVNVPEVGSAIMGTLLGGFALAYRRRKPAL